MSVWPATLPQYLEESGFQEDFPNGSIRTQMDAGPVKVRQRFTAAVTPISGQITLTAAERAILQAFYVTTLGHGTDEFDWVHPITQVACSMRFTGPPTITSAGGGYYRARLALEILP